MRRIDLRLVGRWVFWCAMMALVAATLHSVRGEIDQSHVALTLLLVVLGGSAGGGRWLGFGLAIVGFVLIDYFFQPPYDQLSVSKPLDWVVLVAFLMSAFVATELLMRARDEANTARRRMEEIASLSHIGSEMLRFARPEDALAAVTTLVRHSMGATRATVRLWDASSGLGPVVSASDGERPPSIESELAQRVIETPQSGTGQLTAMLADRSIVQGTIGSAGSSRPLVGLGVPLLVETRRVGVLVITTEGAGIELDAEKRRFLSAIAHYAALGADRVRLVEEARHAVALREESRAKDEVLAAVSHDLRTPLTTIKLLAQAAAARGEPNAAAIEDQTDRLAHLVTNVLDLSRIRAGGVMLDVELNTAEDLVGAAIRRAEGLLHDRRIEPHVDLSDPPPAGRFDFVQSLRILGNLLDNALRFTKPGDCVEIETASEGAWMVVRVRDRGPGVPPSERDRIFEPFYRSAIQVDGSSGHAGLGLSIARRLAEMQGGSLECEGRIGGGSTFTLRLVGADLHDAPLMPEEERVLVD
jgi:two-component system, OmpR family, sensor histidine kinase KdpD